LNNLRANRERGQRRKGENDFLHGAMGGGLESDQNCHAQKKRAASTAVPAARPGQASDEPA